MTMLRGCVFIFAILFVTIPESYGYDLQFESDEAGCRFTLDKMVKENKQWIFYLLSGSICGLSLLFLLASIGVFVYIQRYLMREMDEAIFKACDVIDGVLVSLIPTPLLDEIASEDRKPRKKDE